MPSMSLTPRLPKGFHAQPAFHHQDGQISYDFYRAYNVAREMDYLRSYWLMTSDVDTRSPMPPKSKWLAFGDWARAQHRPFEDYHVFANPQTKLDEVRRWLDATQSGDLVEVKDL
jgi:hypothetical protein